MAALPTPRPWRISPMRESGRIWIEGPEGSAASEALPKDRRVICDFEIVGDEAQDAETEANMALIVERINGGEG